MKLFKLGSNKVSYQTCAFTHQFVALQFRKITFETWRIKNDNCERFSKNQTIVRYWNIISFYIFLIICRPFSSSFRQFAIHEKRTSKFSRIHKSFVPHNSAWGSVLQYLIKKKIFINQKSCMISNVCFTYAEFTRTTKGLSWRPIHWVPLMTQL